MANNKKVSYTDPPMRWNIALNKFEVDLPEAVRKDKAMTSTDQSAKKDRK